MVYDRSMGVVRYTRILLRMLEPQKWCVDVVKDMLTTPWALREPDALGVIHHKSTTQVEVAQNKPAQLRRLYISPEDLEAHGYTKTCKKCQHLLTHGPNTGTMPHSEECRARITAALSETPAGRVQIQK